MNLKHCYKCNKNKDLSYFHKNRAQSSGYATSCKTCSNESRLENYHKNPEPAKKRMKARHQANKVEDSLKSKARYEAKSSEIKAKKAKWQKDNRETYNLYQKNRCQNNIHARLARNLRSRVRDALNGNWKSGSAVGDLGCSVDSLKSYLGSKFTHGMSWDNYGDWHIDHIMPLSRFNLTDRNSFLMACHFTNLQPLWALENLKKSNKMPTHQQS